MLRITNYDDHPTRPGYMVFSFYNKQRAEYFEELLKENDIWFEQDTATEPREEFLFGIKRRDKETAHRLNYLVSAKFRRKTVPYFYLRLVIYIAALGAITLAIIGALKT